VPQAQAGLSVSTPPATSRPGPGFLRVVSPDELNARDAAEAKARRDAAEGAYQPADDLGSYIRRLWQTFRNHRNTGSNNINWRLLHSQRMIEGKYDPEKLAQIEKFGGSQVYARVVAVKCRGASSLMRDVYLGAERPWGIDPQPDPPVPPDIRANIVSLVSSEVQTMQMGGQPVLPDQAHMRYVELMHAATEAARRNAMTQADAASDKIEDILVAGRFYEAMAEFLLDLPIYPFACLKGPVVRMIPKLTWVGKMPLMREVPQMFWERVDPANIYWSPGASCIEEADILERKRLTRSDLNALIGLPGYDEKAIRAALEDYSRGLREWLDSPDTEQAINVGRENPTLNQSQYIDALEFHGRVQGRVLVEEGIDIHKVPDLDRDYLVQSWVVGRHTIKTQLSPSPKQRHPYYLTSFEKVPGAVVGHSLPDILEDIQEVANAAMRSLVNNMAISSGPQVVVNDEALAPTENGDELYPWKRWRVIGADPLGNNQAPITFFQPGSNAQELLQVYNQMMLLADELSGLPRYTTGQGMSSGAGRTASGLGMLMNNAEKVVQSVAANVDRDVLEPVLSSLYDMIMLTDTSGMLTGEEDIRVRGVNVAVQKETERQKQLQFLQITANPIDAPIVGEMGRARVLRSVAAGLGLPDDIVPDDQTLQQMIDAKQRMQQAGQAMVAASQGQPGQPGQMGWTPGSAPGWQPNSGQPSQGQGGPTTSSPGARAQGNQARTPTPAQLSDFAPPVNSFQQGISTHG
jgi:hypothetical protein